MVIQDDRTPEQKKTHGVIIAATDKFMSGWGKASGGVSYAAWACRPEHFQKVYRWVESRSDMIRVRVVGNDWRPRAKGHAHIYLVDEGHPALE